MLLPLQAEDAPEEDGPLLAAMLRSFLRELLPASRSFSDELLAAALELLLSAPVSLLPPQVNSVESSFLWNPI